jgi:hypothetical protein
MNFDLHTNRRQYPRSEVPPIAIKDSSNFGLPESNREANIG